MCFHHIVCNSISCLIHPLVLVLLDAQPAAKKSATPKKTATKKATATKPKKTATKPKKTATKKKTTKAAEAKQ